jgi:hypothetical protein
MNAAEPMRARDRVVAVLLALPIVAGGVFVGFLGLLLDSFRCWEGCGYPPTSWHDDPDAWQWTAQAVLAGGVFVASLAAGVLIVAGRRRGWAVALVAGLALLGAWLGLTDLMPG